MVDCLDLRLREQRRHIKLTGLQARKEYQTSLTILR